MVNNNQAQIKVVLPKIQEKTEKSGKGRRMLQTATLFNCTATNKLVQTLYFVLPHERIYNIQFQLPAFLQCVKYNSWGEELPATIIRSIHKCTKVAAASLRMKTRTAHIGFVYFDALMHKAYFCVLSAPQNASKILTTYYPIEREVFTPTRS